MVYFYIISKVTSLCGCWKIAIHLFFSFNIHLFSVSLMDDFTDFKTVKGETRNKHEPNERMKWIIRKVSQRKNIHCSHFDLCTWQWEYHVSLNENKTRLTQDKPGYAMVTTSKSQWFRSYSHNKAIKMLHREWLPLADSGKQASSVLWHSPEICKVLCWVFLSGPQTDSREQSIAWEVFKGQSQEWDAQFLPTFLWSEIITRVCPAQRETEKCSLALNPGERGNWFLSISTTMIGPRFEFKSLESSRARCGMELTSLQP